MDWLTGPGPYSGQAAPAAEFPSVLPLNEATDWLENLPASHVLMGVDGEGEPVTVDLSTDSPHILVSASTGAGKSAVARSVAVQRASLGDLVVFLDIKCHSHRWARQLAPLAHYADSPAAIGDALVNVGREVHRRNAAVKMLPPDVPLSAANLGPDILVVFEEMNATTSRLKVMDRQRPKGAYGAVEALSDIAFMGRAVNVRLVSFAQLASYRASGGSEIVESYGTRVLINYSRTAWRYLAEGCGQYVPAPEAVGRGMVCRGNRAVETQLLWVPEQEAAAYVLDSVPAQRRVRELSGGRRGLPQQWRAAIGR
jgi:hypothetical protein